MKLHDQTSFMALDELLMQSDLSLQLTYRLNVNHYCLGQQQDYKGLIVRLANAKVVEEEVAL